MNITGYTNYFKQKWFDNYNSEPVIEELNDSLEKRSIKIQQYKNLFDKRTKTFTNILAVYWLPNSDIILKIDAETKSIVTFYTKNDFKKGKMDEIVLGMG